MKKRKRSKPIKGEFPLPETMIQHIQSFLGCKAAAQSSLLSKSWHSAWYTPKPDFDMLDFVRNKDLFWKFVEKTIQRYEESNLKIESFRLFVAKKYYMSNLEDSIDMDMVEELIAKAIKLGPVDFNIGNEWLPITLPSGVLGSETLTELSLRGCRIELGEGRKVSCSGLKCLSLKNVEMKSDTLWDIVSSCPLIEKFIIIPSYQGPSLGSVVSGPINLYRLYKLNSLTSCGLDFDSSFFSDMSSKFPFLKDLSLTDCVGYEGVELCSRSLECLSFVHPDYHVKLLWAKCDVPNIRKFKFKGRNLPSLSFKTASRKWESDITICSRNVSDEWFFELNKLLDSLSLSRISLSLFSF